MFPDFICKVYDQEKSGTILLDGLNLRSEPTVLSVSVGTKRKDDKVAIVGEAMNGFTKWYQVEGGWLAARFVQRGLLPPGPFEG